MTNKNAPTLPRHCDPRSGAAIHPTQSWTSAQSSCIRSGMEIRVEQATALDAELDPLVAEADADGHLFMRRLRDEWASGSNRFDGPGEKLMVARAGDRLLGIGGLNRDPYAQAPGIGRLRHLYVARDTRCRGVGTLLVHAILAGADAHFTLIRLRTDSAEAAAFYARLGFRANDGEGATHIMPIS
jgi:GNAT superfamily N-acetyltransferase